MDRGTDRVRIRGWIEILDREMDREIDREMSRGS
jgi:hypothetical protein